GSDAGGDYRVPASDRASLAAAALGSRRSEGEFEDRGRPVLVAARRLSSLGWAIVVEVDRDAAFAASRRHTLWILAGAAGLLAAVVGIGHAWRRALRARHFHDMSGRDARYRVLLEQTQEAVAVAVDRQVRIA